MEKTLIIVKPDAVERGLSGQIIARFEAKGLFVAGMKLMRVTKALAERHYAEHKGKPFFGALVQFITSGPVVVMALTGNDAIRVCRALIGSTNCAEAAPGTIRGDLGMSKQRNMVHASDSPAAAKRELALFFKKSELQEPAAESVRRIYG